MSESLTAQAGPRELKVGDRIGVFCCHADGFDIWIPHHYAGVDRGSMVATGAVPWQPKTTVYSPHPVHGDYDGNPRRLVYRFADEIQFVRFCPDCRASGTRRTRVTVDDLTSLAGGVKTQSDITTCVRCDGATRIPCDPFARPLWWRVHHHLAGSHMVESDELMNTHSERVMSGDFTGHQEGTETFLQPHWLFAEDYEVIRSLPSDPTPEQIASIRPLLIANEARRAQARAELLR